MVKPRIHQQPDVYLTPSPQELSPRPSSAFEEFCQIEIDLTASRPPSEVFSSRSSSPKYNMSSSSPVPPSLTDILLDISPPPWTLTAFMAYLSQNHCMETLEFTLDSQRYATIYNELHVETPYGADSNNRLCTLWERLMQVYIIPCAPREINIPARVRDRLLNVTCGPEPPHPSMVNEAGRIIYELMNDSLLVPFLESVAPVHVEHSDHQGTSPKSPALARATSVRGARYSRYAIASSQPLEPEGLTDDSEGNSPATTEPMTPPTTPPTADWGMQATGGLQRAVAAHNKGWKKVGQKLGFTRKPSNRHPSSSSRDSESSRGGGAPSNPL